MSVMVYSRLGAVLRGKNMTVSDLARAITERFGLEVDERTLDRLTQTARVRRPDIEVAGAAAAALDVGLDDVFAVEAVPITEESTDAESAEKESVLTPAESRRLRQLYEQQGQRALTEDEWAEMRALVDEQGRRLYERGVQDIAARRGQPVEQVRAELAADLEQKRAWRRDLEADPARLDALIQESWERQRARIGR